MAPGKLNNKKINVFNVSFFNLFWPFSAANPKTKSQTRLQKAKNQLKTLKRLKRYAF